MALSTAGMAGAAGGGMTVNPGTAFGGNALATPQTFSGFEPPPGPGAAPGGSAAGGGGGGAGGAFDLKGWDRGQGEYEDMHACLGVDVSTCTIKVCLHTIQ